MSNVFDYPEPKEEYTFSDAVSDAFDNYEKFVSGMVQYSEEQYRDYERERAEMIKDWD